ncbi:hypothetical protein Pint_34845 [Pistacia integerrima]|uniref:Uncharacterized protein n=1 Tax=Pistacia integerrima TaxID=434235 RepID=A0ACC0X3J0_9ROSI|nr:hypothetical protein Pint_34845 [Pistacia integerrima]
MLPPPRGTFVDREELIQHVGDFGRIPGMWKLSSNFKRDKVAVLGCDRGGVYCNRRKTIDESSAESIRTRKTGSRLTNCPVRPFQFQSSPVPFSPVQSSPV